MANNFITPDEYFTIFMTWDIIFDIIHVRGKIESINGINFIIHSNEAGKHNKPHIHCQYQCKEVVIEIESAKILAGNIPVSKQKIAQKWISTHHDYIADNWNKLSNGMILPVF